MIDKKEIDEEFNIEVKLLRCIKNGEIYGI